MQAAILVHLMPGGPWLPAILSDERAESSYGLPVVVVDGEDNARGPREVETIRVFSTVPAELVDAAVAAGFNVERQVTT